MIDFAALAREKSGIRPAAPAATKPEPADLSKARLEIRAVERRQLYVDGKPVGEVFE